jgi:UDP-2-acetamido-2-deoxy-ribo-hexuluronate aminotransferase
MEFIDLKTQLAKIRSEVDARIAAVMAHGQFIMGPEIAELETRLAAFVGVEHCITVSSGTDALLMALMALDLKPGDEVITTPFTFFATVEVMLLLQIKPVFVDINSDTYNINPDLIEQAITERTRAIMPVSMYGQCADLKKINQIAAKHSLAVIEDAAQSFGATHHGKVSGSLTTIACTSFFPSKPLGCYGDGGACFTNDAALAEKLRCIRVHGQVGRYNHVALGINGRMDTLQAAMMLPKLDLFESEIAARQVHAAYYTSFLSNNFKTPFVKSYNKSVFAQYTIEVDNREAVQTHLQKNGIPTAVHYPKSLHQQPLLQKLQKLDGQAIQQQSFPEAEKAASRVLSLPFHPYLTEEDMQRVAACLGDFVK